MLCDYVSVTVLCLFLVILNPCSAALCFFKLAFSHTMNNDAVWCYFDHLNLFCLGGVLCLSGHFAPVYF